MKRSVKKQEPGTSVFAANAACIVAVLVGFGLGALLFESAAGHVYASEWRACSAACDAGQGAFAKGFSVLKVDAGGRCECMNGAEFSADNAREFVRP